MDHLAQLESKCLEASAVLDKLGSVSNHSFSKGHILFNAEETVRHCKENLSAQARELQGLNQHASKKEEKLVELKLSLDRLKLRHSQLVDQVDQAKTRAHAQGAEENMLAEKQRAMTLRFKELEEKILVLEKFKKPVTSTAAVQEGGLESFLRQSELFKRMGLSVSKLPNARIRVSFHLVDPLDYQRQFSFLVHVADDQYVVEDVRPEIAVRGDLPEMVRQLNRTNDFAHFVRTIRKRFQDSCQL